MLAATTISCQCLSNDWPGVYGQERPSGCGYRGTVKNICEHIFDNSSSLVKRKLTSLRASSKALQVFSKAINALKGCVPKPQVCAARSPCHTHVTSGPRSAILNLLLHAMCRFWAASLFGVQTGMQSGPFRINGSMRMIKTSSPHFYRVGNTHIQLASVTQDWLGASGSTNLMKTKQIARSRRRLRLSVLVWRLRPQPATDGTLMYDFIAHGQRHSKSLICLAMDAGYRQRQRK
jgi:hypothetical protein